MARLRYTKLFRITDIDRACKELAKEGMLLDIERYYSSTYGVGDVVKTKIEGEEYVGLITQFSGMTNNGNYYFEVYLLTDDGWDYIKGHVVEQRMEDMANEMSNR